MHFVKKAKYLSGYRIKLTFEDNKKGIVDLGPYLKGEIFESLKNINYFKTVKVNPELDTIVWDNGADLCPDFLYELGTKKQS